MTDRERLIELYENSLPKNNGVYLKKDIEEAVDYLLTNGVIVPPFNAGDIVYCVDDVLKIIDECKVYGFTVVNGELKLLVDNGECKFVTSNWHKTKDIAKAKLAFIQGWCEREIDK